MTALGVGAIGGVSLVGGMALVGHIPSGPGLGWVVGALFLGLAGLGPRPSNVRWVPMKT